MQNVGALVHPLRFAEPMLLAHQGGWDEFLMVAVPVVIFGILLKVANRRADSMGEPTEHEGPPEL